MARLYTDLKELIKIKSQFQGIEAFPGRNKKKIIDIFEKRIRINIYFFQGANREIAFQLNEANRIWGNTTATHYRDDIDINEYPIELKMKF